MSSLSAGAAITTVAGLGAPEKPHPVQAAFIAEQALQCGYCASGMIVAAAALLAKKPDPSDGEIREALEGHLCRCGTHDRIVRAVRRAAGKSGGTSAGSAAALGLVAAGVAAKLGQRALVALTRGGDRCTIADLGEPSARESPARTQSVSSAERFRWLNPTGAPFSAAPGS